MKLSPSAEYLQALSCGHKAAEDAPSTTSLRKITSPSVQSLAEEEPTDLEAAAGNPLCLVVADRSSFELLALVPSCATDHMPDNYYQVSCGQFPEHSILMWASNQ
jgi:hypothetical protein